MGYFAYTYLVTPFFLQNLMDCRGYLAPEYALLGQLTMKADVYSFGVLILEIVSGKSSSQAAFGPGLMVLVEWVCSPLNLVHVNLVKQYL